MVQNSKVTPAYGRNNWEGLLKECKLLDAEELHTKGKAKYIDFLAKFSFNVPSTDVRASLAEDLTNAVSDNNCSAADITAVLMSVSQINEFKELSTAIGPLLAELFLKCENTKFLDYVLSSDWGKFFLLDSAYRTFIFKSILDKELYKHSDELAVLILKSACTMAGRRLIYDVISEDKFKETFIKLIIAAKGKTGGLLRSTAFLVRRQPIQKTGATEFPAEKLSELIQAAELDPLTSYAVASLAARIFYINCASLINNFFYTNKSASVFFSMTIGRPFLVWSKIQLECMSLNLSKYEPTAINKNNLDDFYEALLQTKPSKIAPPNQHEKKVGVIITTFNPDVSKIKHSIASILRQSHKNIEVCIIDDASEPSNFEALVKIVAKLNDPRIRLERNAKNIGQYRSRNKAINLVKDADYYAIQDDDDFSHPDRLLAQIEDIDNNPAIMLTMCKQARFTEGMQYVPDKVDPTLFDPSPASSLFKKGVISILGGFADVRSRGDVEFISRIKKNFGENAISFVDAPLYLMRCTPDTVSASKDRYLKTQLDVFRLLMSHGTHTTYMDGQQHALFK